MSGTVQSRSIFPYPGGKSYLAPWVMDHLPEHECYVEVFGGSAAVLLGKPESRIEVYNDTDEDLVHFFRTFRDHTDQLVEYLEKTPYAKEIHDEWAELYYKGYRPTDDVERAGRWFYLRFSQFAAKYNGVSGFRSMKQRSPAEQLNKVRDRLEEFAKRFDHVQIENRDFSEIFKRFDGDETVFYCDPPYVEEGDDLYTHGSFDHKRFIDDLEDLEGYWLVSYTDVPDPLRKYEIREKGIEYSSQNGSDGSHKEATERLVMNFDPGKTDLFSRAQQQTLDSVSNQGGGSDSGGGPEESE